MNMINYRYVSILSLFFVGQSFSQATKYPGRGHWFYKYAVERLSKGGFDYCMKPTVKFCLEATDFDSQESIKKAMEEITVAEDDLKKQKSSWLYNIVRAEKQIREHCSDSVLETWKTVSTDAASCLSETDAKVVRSPGYEKCLHSIKNRDYNEGICALAREDLNAYAEIKAKLGALSCVLSQKKVIIVDWAKLEADLGTANNRE